MLTLKIIPNWITPLAAGFLPNASTPFAAVRPKVKKPKVNEPKTTRAAIIYLKIGDRTFL